MAIHESAYKVVLLFGKKHAGQTFGYIYENDKSYLEWLSRTEGLGKWQQLATDTLAGLPISDGPVSTVKLGFLTHFTGPTSGKMTIKEMDEKWVSVSFPHNKDNIYDVKRLEDFRVKVANALWTGPPLFVWKIPVVELPNIGKFASKWFGKENTIVSSAVKDAFKSIHKRRQSLDEIRDKEDIEFNVPGLLLPLYGYQKVCVKFGELAGGRFIVGDAPGVGKTFEAIAYAVYTNSKTLFITPKNAKIQWKRAIKRLTGKNVCYWDTKGREGDLSEQFHLINYDIVAKNLPLILEQKYDLLVCDEITKILNKKTQRAKAIIGNWHERKKYPGIKTKHVMFLSGTPVTKHHLQFFALLRFIDPSRFKDWMNYTSRYGGPNETPRNMVELNDSLKNIMIRRLLKDVQKDLPPRQRNPIYIELTPAQLAEYRKVVLSVLKSLKDSPSAPDMHPIAQFLIRAKMEYIKEFIDEHVDNGQVTINYSTYREPMQELAQHYGSAAAYIDGTMSDVQRQEQVDRLVDGKATVACFTMGAAGEAIDGLQHVSSTVNFFNIYFVPWIHEQAEGRAYRTGQTKHVQANYFIAEGTVDEDLWELLTERQKNLDLMLDGKLSDEESNKLKKKSYLSEIMGRLQSQFKSELTTAENSNPDDIADEV